MIITGKINRVEFTTKDDEKITLTPNETETFSQYLLGLNVIAIKNNKSFLEQEPEKFH